MTLNFLIFLVIIKSVWFSLERILCVLCLPTKGEDDEQ